MYQCPNCKVPMADKEAVDEGGVIDCPDCLLTLEHVCQCQIDGRMSDDCLSLEACQRP